MNAEAQARLLRRIARGAVEFAPLDPHAQVWAAFPDGDRRRRPVVRLADEEIARWRRDGWLEAAGEDRWRLSAEGRAAARRAEANDPSAAFADQHRLYEPRSFADDDERRTQRAVNVGDSALAWLARRFGPDGAPLISPRQRAAGERRRRDHELARRGPKLTMDWSGEPSDGRPRAPSTSTVEPAPASSTARRRVAAALDAVGPGLADALKAVCLDDLGLDAAERALKWPQRSARLVLAIALDRLADHYGLVR